MKTQPKTELTPEQALILAQHLLDNKQALKTKPVGMKWKRDKSTSVSLPYSNKDFPSHVYTKGDAVLAVCYYADHSINVVLLADGKREVSEDNLIFKTEFTKEQCVEIRDFASRKVALLEDCYWLNRLGEWVTFSVMYRLNWHSIFPSINPYDETQWEKRTRILANGLGHRTWLKGEKRKKKSQNT